MKSLKCYVGKNSASYFRFLWLIPINKKEGALNDHQTGEGTHMPDIGFGFLFSFLTSGGKTASSNQEQLKTADKSTAVDLHFLKQLKQTDSPKFMFFCKTKDQHLINFFLVMYDVIKVYPVSGAPSRTTFPTLNLTCLFLMELSSSKMAY